MSDSERLQTTQKQEWVQLEPSNPVWSQISHPLQITNDDTFAKGARDDGLGDELPHTIIRGDQHHQTYHRIRGISPTNDIAYFLSNFLS
jgi:hypothetical protein